MKVFRLKTARTIYDKSKAFVEWANCQEDLFADLVKGYYDDTITVCAVGTFAKSVAIEKARQQIKNFDIFEIKY